MEDKKVYVINADEINIENLHINEVSNEEFCEIAKKDGSVYSLDDFVKAFNLELIDSSNAYIRII